MKSKISLAFNNCRRQRRPALITYTVAGDNTKNNSLKILNKISKHADILELGLPHNTPIADGGQIQGSSYRALKNGIKLKDVFHIVKKFKKNNPEKPIILMGYFNLIYQNGEDKFLKSCKSSGVDGLIIVDLPYPENKIFAYKCKKNSISFIQLYNEQNNIKEATVITASPINKELESDILSKINMSDAKSISLTNVVDPSIIGGFIIRYDGKEYNASVKQNLNNLKKELTN